MFLQLLSVLHKAFGFCSEMNGGVLPCLMSQLMAFSCLISIVLNVSVCPSSSTAQLSATREGPRLPPGCGGPGVPRPLCNEGRGGGVDLHTLRPHALGYYF